MRSSLSYAAPSLLRLLICQKFGQISSLPPAVQPGGEDTTQHLVEGREGAARGDGRGQEEVRKGSGRGQEEGMEEVRKRSGRGQ